MKSAKLVVALSAVFFLLGASGARAAPHTQPKVNSSSERVQAAKPQPRAARSDSKVRGHKRPVQRDAQLDYPQLG